MQQKLIKFESFQADDIQWLAQLCVMLENRF
jgi:hypothetical protein